MVIETATEQSAQDVTDKIESLLYPEGDQSAEPKEGDDDVVLEDEGDNLLPDDDDTDSDDDDGSDDELDDIAGEEDLSLAEYLGIDDDKLDQDEDGNWLYNATIDGEEKQVPLSELTKSFQLQGHVNNKSIALQNERKEFEEQQTTIAAEIKQRVDGAKQLASILENEVVNDYKSIDWDALRASNPNEWAALRQEYAEKAQRIQKMQVLVAEEATRLNEEAMKTNQEKMGKHLLAEKEMMLIQNPTWVDPATLKKDMGVLKEFVKTTYGFSDDDTKLVTDHRLIGLIQDAQKFREGTKKAEDKKGKKVPKFQKPGASRKQASSLAKARGIKAKRAAVKKTGSTQDVANLLESRM